MKTLRREGNTYHMWKETPVAMWFSKKVSNIDILEYRHSTVKNTHNLSSAQLKRILAWFGEHRRNFWHFKNLLLYLISKLARGHDHHTFLGEDRRSFMERTAFLPFCKKYRRILRRKLENIMAHVWVVGIIRRGRIFEKKVFLANLNYFFQFRAGAWSLEQIFYSWRIWWHFVEFLSLPNFH